MCERGGVCVGCVCERGLCEREGVCGGGVCVRRRETCVHSSPNHDHPLATKTWSSNFCPTGMFFKHRPLFYCKLNRSLSLERAVPLPPTHQGLAAASSPVLPQAGGWLRTRPGQGPSRLVGTRMFPAAHSSPRTRDTLSQGDGVRGHTRGQWEERAEPDR